MVEPTAAAMAFFASENLQLFVNEKQTFRKRTDCRYLGTIFFGILQEQRFAALC